MPPSVTGVVTDASGQTASWSANWSLDSAAPAKVIGYWAPAASYDSRLQVVGAAGVKARRIYGDLVAGGNSQSTQIVAAHNAGMLPVVSYKLGSWSIAQATSGQADAAADATAGYLASFNKPTAVAIWHEPADDMSGADFTALQRRLIGFFKRGQLKVGPILHGWLLDNQRPLWETYLDQTLLDNTYDFVGIDSYQTGSASSPGPIMPGDRIAPLLDVLASRGHPDMPIGVGEYNAFTAAGLRSAGEKFLSTPNLTWACMWDQTSGIATQLTGDRVTAFKETKADPRAMQ